MGAQLFGASVGDHGGDGDQAASRGGSSGRRQMSPNSMSSVRVTSFGAKSPRAICPGTIETPMVTDMTAKGELSIPKPSPTNPSAASAVPTKSPPPSSGLAAPPPASSSA